MQIEDWIVHDIPDAVIDQASDWIVQLDKLEHDDAFAAACPSTTLLRQDFYDWLNRDHLHQLAFLQLSEMWAKSSMLRHMEHLIDKSEVIQFPNLHAAPALDVEPGPILIDHHDTLSAPAWMYNVVIGLVVVGTLIPFLL